MISRKKKIGIIIVASISFCLIVFLALFFSIPRFKFEKVEDEFHIVDYYGNKKDILIPSLHDGLPVTRISVRAFENKKMEKLVFEEDSNIKIIERLAFNDCPNLKELVFPSSLIEIENNAFMDCESLESVIFNDGLLYIGGSSFFQCNNLKEVTISETVLLLGSYAFYGCTNLEEIFIPLSCRSVYNNVFSYCSNLKRIYVYSSTTLHKNYKEDCTAETIIVDLE